MTKFHLALLTFVFWAPASIADSYRLINGDKIIVDYELLDEPKETSIDLDGNIRLPAAGRIQATGRTLDELEQQIAQGVTLGGFSGVPDVLVEVSEYAPIVVSGFVQRSGKYNYVSGLDVNSALALAGGLGDSAVERTNSDILTISARRRATSAAERILANVTAIARLEAALLGPDTAVTLSPQMRDLVPAAQRLNLESRLQSEAIQLTELRKATAASVASWNSDIQDYDEQIKLLNERIEIKEEAIAFLTEEVTNSEKLRAQGLLTTSRFSVQQQRLADDREELLALETAKITARRAATLAARNRDTLQADLRARDRVALKAAETDLSLALKEYEFALDELTALSDTAESDTDQDTDIRIRFQVRGPRAGRFAGQSIERSTALLPGDVVIVEVVDDRGNMR